MLKPASRPFQIGDEPSIVSLYNKITGRKRTVEQHQWEWLDPPAGQGWARVIEDKASDSIIGHHGLIPLNIVYNNVTYCMGKTENTIIHPKLMGNGMYFYYEKKFFSEYPEDKFDLFATTSGHGIPRKIRKRLNYKPVSQYEIYFSLCRGSNIKKMVIDFSGRKKILRRIKAIVGNVAGFVGFFAQFFFKSKKVNTKNLVVGYEQTLQSISTDLDAFWKKNHSHFGITVERTSHFLKWRIFENPYVDYTVITLKQQDRLVGYAIVKKKKGTVPYGVIEDIIAENMDMDFYLALLEEIKSFFNKEQCIAVVFPTLKGNSSVSKIFRLSGYHNSKFAFKLSKKLLKRNLPTDTEFLIHQSHCEIDSQDLYDPSKWYFTGLFFEGIN